MDENITMNAGAENTAGETAENAAATAEVVAPQAETAPEAEQQATVDAPASVESKPQNRGKNAQMKEYRRKAEALDGMSNGIMALARAQGLQPSSAEEALEMLEAKHNGVSLEEHRRAKTDAAAEQEAMVRNHPLFKEMEERAAGLDADAAAYRVSQAMQRDLEAIQAIDPSVQSLQDLEGYSEMVEAGITGVNAYYALKGRAAVKAAATPAAPGAVGSPGDTDRDYTSAELDRLEGADLLKNDKLFKKAMRSLSKLK